ncbi:hypothetical protein [Laspinema palackyanum]|uniref:hypothetical protein n=1 Tax=Laspinema palackyanum TaxID=3231601 RepID=UPI00345D8584|nr:hypothetical protein [Laspinema sp. D2c]
MPSGNVRQRAIAAHRVEVSANGWPDLSNVRDAAEEAQLAYQYWAIALTVKLNPDF